MRLWSCLLFALLLVAAPGAPGAAPETAAPETPAPAAAAPPSGGATEEAEEPSLGEFVPTEELPADSEISFPVDI